MTDTGEPALLSASVLVVVQRAKFASSRAEYDIYAPDGTPYGSVHQQFGSGAGFLGQLATITYDVVGADGQLLMQLNKPGTIGRAHFEVTWGNGSPLGSIEQENLLFAPQFALAAADGTSARLSGGAMMSWDWQLEDSQGQAVGSVSKQFAGLAELFSSADRFVVQLSAVLTGALRALAIVATVCLDEVRTAKRRR
ncbi:MAG: phospholipid scramblase-related protein [Acidothermaceae bacterium]